MALCNGDSKVSLWRGGPSLNASGRRLGSGASEPPRGDLPRPLPQNRQRSPGAGAAARREATGRGPVACILESGRCFVDFLWVSGFLRPPSAGRRGGRQLPTATLPALAPPRRCGAPSPRSAARGWG